MLVAENLVFLGLVWLAAEQDVRGVS
jgi:hypothetical protein